MEILHFLIDEVDYGCDLADIDEILNMAAIQAVSRGPDFIAGMLNLRGCLLPVIDLSLMLGHHRELPPPPISADEPRLGLYKDNCRLFVVAIDNSESSVNASGPKSTNRLVVIIDGWIGLKEIDEEDQQSSVVEKAERLDYIHELSVSDDSTIQLIRIKQILDSQQLAMLV